MWRRDQAQEQPVLAPDELRLLGKGVVLLPQPILLQPRAIAFIGREVLDVVDGIAPGRRAFVRREITDEVGAAARDRLASILKGSSS
jgi:hypothetical protein